MLDSVFTVFLSSSMQLPILDNSFLFVSMITKTVCSFQHMIRLRVLKLPENPFGLHGFEKNKKNVFAVYIICVRCNFNVFR